MSEKLDRLHQGQVAQLMLRELSLKVADRQEVILKGLIRDYQGGKLDAQKAVAGIAQITALRSLLADYERKAVQGREVMEELHARAS